MKIGIIGSGNVGITTAFSIAEHGSGEVLLYDVVEGRAKGKALDLVEAAPLRRYDRRIEGTDQFSDLLDRDLFIIAAGHPRKSSMNRLDLFKQNLPIIKEVANSLKDGCRSTNPPLAIVLTEPVDLMTAALLKYTGWSRERVMGVGGVLSSARLKHFIARELNVSTTDINAMVIGSHDDDMVILEHYCRVSGLPLSQFLSRTKIDQLFSQTVSAGSQIVDLAKIQGSFYTPGAAAGLLADAIANDSNRIYSVSVQLQGEYGLENACLSLPVRIGRNGIQQIYPLELTEQQRQALQRSMERYAPYLSEIV